MRGHLITHKDCLDGATAALVGWASGLQPTFVEPDGAQSVLERFIHETPSLPIFLADVSVPAASYSEWQPHIAWLLDHHATALPLAGQAGVTIDVGRAGSRLMYDFAVSRGWMTPSHAWDRLTAMVQKYDLWQPRHEFGQDLERLFRSCGLSWYRDRFGRGWVPYTADEASHLADLVAEEARFLQRNLSRVHRVAAGNIEVAGLFMEEEGSINEIAHRLLEQGYGLVIVAKIDRRLSARSDQRVDSADLMAKLFNGGGHRRAAGGRVPQDLPASEAGLQAILHDVQAFLADR